MTTKTPPPQPTDGYTGEPLGHEARRLGEIEGHLRKISFWVTLWSILAFVGIGLSLLAFLVILGV